MTTTETFINGLKNTPFVTYDDILLATNNFATQNILGRGGYGIVYKGVWKHIDVAVKRIQNRKDTEVYF